MLNMARRPDADMRDLEHELAHSIRSRQTDDGNPLEGLFTLNRRMVTEEEDQFDVDSTILDFLAFKATDSVFEWQSSSNPHQSDLPSALVTITAEWRTVLKHRYNGRRLSDQVAFRSRLLQFVLLFTHRLNHDKTWTNEESLNELHRRNNRRGVFWNQEPLHSPALRNHLDTRGDFPLSRAALLANRNELSSGLGIPQNRRRWVGDLEGTPSLHCLLPLFVELAAARTNLDDEWLPTKDWLRLAGQFMLQTVLEEYLRNGASRDETFNTIFAFGFPRTDVDAENDDDILAMRKVFYNPTNVEEQVHGWAKIRRHFINELLPDSASPTELQAMEAAQDRYPYLAFEAQLLSFLKDLHDGLVKPDLVQVEQRRITIHGTELPEDDSREMFRRMGI